MSSEKASNNSGFYPIKGQNSGLCSRTRARKEYTCCIATRHSNNFTEFKHTGYSFTNALPFIFIDHLTLNDPCMCRTAPLTSKRCILYVYSTNIGTEYFKRALYSPFFFSSKCSLFHNANLFGSCIIHILYIGCAEIKKK